MWFILNKQAEMKTKKMGIRQTGIEEIFSLCITQSISLAITGNQDLSVGPSEFCRHLGFPGILICEAPLGPLRCCLIVWFVFPAGSGRPRPS